METDSKFQTREPNFADRQRTDKWQDESSSGTGVAAMLPGLG